MVIPIPYACYTAAGLEIFQAHPLVTNVARCSPWGPLSHEPLVKSADLYDRHLQNLPPPNLLGGDFYADCRPKAVGIDW